MHLAEQVVWDEVTASGKNMCRDSLWRSETALAQSEVDMVRIEMYVSIDTTLSRSHHCFLHQVEHTSGSNSISEIRFHRMCARHSLGE